MTFGIPEWSFLLQKSPLDALRHSFRLQKTTLEGFGIFLP